MDPKREMLRHTLATLAYRGGKAIRDAPPGFATFRVGESTRLPGEILAHIGDLLEWGLSMAEGAEAWRPAEAGAWDTGVGRFYSALGRLDGFLASDKALACPPERVFQGPIADALTHVGQIAMLRRLAGFRIRGENYSRAAIEAGRVGDDQAPPRREFD